MDENEYKKILDDYLAGKLSEEKEKQIDQWLEAIKLQEEEEGIPWSEARQNKLLEAIHHKMEIPVRPLYTRQWVKIAAVWIIFMVAAVSLWTVLKPVDVLTVTTSGSLTKTILADGTIVWLKANSTLSYPTGFEGSTRDVTLQGGEALFEVAKDARHPFIIQCGDLTATVLGTSFNIKTGKEHIEVTVLTGKVGLTSRYDKQGITVSANEKAKYNAEHHQIAKVVMQRDEITQIVRSTDYSMSFDRTTVHDIVKRIERKFNVQVSMDGNTLDLCTITADFTDQSLETTLASIADVFDFQYVIQGSHVTIRGGTCR
ncbi:MAG: FecR family protein [Bacteroidota bacterium]